MSVVQEAVPIRCDSGSEIFRFGIELRENGAMVEECWYKHQSQRDEELVKMQARPNYLAAQIERVKELKR